LQALLQAHMRQSLPFMRGKNTSTLLQAPLQAPMQAHMRQSLFLYARKIRQSTSVLCTSQQAAN
jgi:hypothetical protein